MTQEFIPYQQALEVKELGFDEPCFSVYYNGEYHEHGIQNQFLHEKNECSAPLYQQAFRWFRKNHNLDGWVVPYLDDTLYSYLILDKSTGKMEEDDADQATHEEAELACLNKLIEIVKTKNI